MIDFLYSIDVSIFYFINKTLANSFFDSLMPFITTEKHWFLLYVFAWFILLIKGGKNRFYIAIGVILLVALSDQISSSVLKSLVGRIRPCHVLPDINLLVGCTDSGSFPSSHAVNNFCMAMYISHYYKNLKWLMFSIAIVLGLSRIFVGVHYPSDILGGALIGMGIGYLFYKLLDFVILFGNKKLKRENSV